MRIHSVALKNLNSLYGEHEIDFVRQLGDAPLFLIVGPTGAGKSTIMDAVSLALFGTTPRLSGKSGDEDARMVMSRGTGRCFAAVVFSKQNPGEKRRLFRAEWECWRSRDRADGSLQKPKRRLFELLDPLGLETRSLADDDRAKFFAPKFEEVLEGLTPEEFQRSMLLAQGQFSAFLRASVEERAAILERLTSTERYREIGARALARWQAAKEHRDGLRAKVDAIEVLTAAELDDLRKRAAEAAGVVAAASKRRAEAEARLEWEKRRAQLENDIADAEEKLVVAQTRYENFSDKRARLLESDRCAEAGELWRQLAETEKNARVARGRSDQAADVLEELSATVAARAAAAATAADALTTAIDGVQRRHPGLELGDAGDAGADGSTAVRAALARQREVLLEQRATMIRARDIRADLARDQARAATLAETEKAARSAAAEADTRRAALQKKIDQDTIRLEEIDRSLETLRLVLGLSDKRRALVDGDACPLCGSTEHPWAADAEARDRGAQAKVDEAVERRRAVQEAIRTNNAAAARAQVDRARAETEANNAAQEAQAIAERRAAREEALERTLSVMPESDRGDLDAAIAATESRRADLAEEATRVERAERARVDAEEALRVARSKQEQQAALVAERAGARDRLATRVAELRALLESKLLELEIPDLETLQSLVLSHDERAALAEAVADVTSKRERAQGTVEALRAQLAAHALKCPEGFDPSAHAFEALVAEAEESLTALHAAQEERARLAAELEQHSEDRDRRAGLLEAFDAAEQDVILWDEMRKLIGSSEGGAFQRYAQTLNLAELIDRANTRLRELAPRYSLVVARDREGRPELAFAVRDHEHADRVRPQTTLSGGETFLVSLALALALSDYRQTQMPIETLLLDEGFGTLDADTLDIAMSALERLCADGGTQIGVISHVEALRERIGAQVVVEKLGGGRSRLNVRA